MVDRRIQSVGLDLAAATELLAADRGSGPGLELQAERFRSAADLESTALEARPEEQKAALEAEQRDWRELGLLQELELAK